MPHRGRPETRDNIGEPVCEGKDQPSPAQPSVSSRKTPWIWEAFAMAGHDPTPPSPSPGFGQESIAAGEAFLRRLLGTTAEDDGAGDHTDNPEPPPPEELTEERVQGWASSAW